MPPAAFSDLKQMLDQTLAFLDLEKTAADYRAKGHTPKRFRWDMFWTIPNETRNAWFDEHLIYASMDDSHIDTALRKIFPQTW